MTTAPILQVKGNKPFAPFSNLNSEVALIQVWQAVSKASQFLEQGKRLENLSWRLWSLQALGEDSDDVALLNRGRVAGHILNRDKGAPALLPPSGQPKAKCCKIDPSVPCVHKKHKSTSRGALAAGPSVPLRAPTYQGAENIDSTPTDAFASSSRTTLDANPVALGLSQNLPPQQQPTQPLWPISNVSPHAHLAPSPFFQPSHNNQNQHAVPPAPQGVPSAAQMMLSALMDSLLSAGVAPSVAAQAVQQNPAGLMNTLTYQGLGPFGGIGSGDLQQQGGTGTLPTTPMDWSTASFSTTNNFSHPFAPGPSETGSGSAVPVPEQRRVNDLRQQMQLSISTSTSSPTMEMSPAAMSEPSGSSLAAATVGTAATTAGIVVDNADGKPASSSKQLSKKRASLDVGATGSAAGSTSAKGKGKASTNPLQMSPDASSSSKTKDGVSGGTKRGPLQTTSSSARKAASTVASPAAPPDQAPPQCSNCGVKKTPLWRRCGEQHELLCNACGLYWAMHKTHRPEKLKHHRSGRNVGGGGGGGGGGAVGEDEDGYGPHGGSSGAGGTISEDDGPETLCSNCGTSTTPLWRKDREGNTVCNACGLFMKLHGNARPVKMRADVIKKRVRYDHPLSPTGGSGMSPLAGGSGSGGQGTMLLGSPGGGGGMGLASGSGSTGGNGNGNGTGMGIGLEAMDLDVALANLHASGAMLDPSSSSTRDLLSNFAHEQQQQSGPSNGVSAAGPFATFHPGSDTLGRLTTTAGGSIPGTSTSTPLSQAQTPTAFAAQQHHHQQDPINAQQQQQQRHRQEQEQWAQAAGFLLPHEPVGDGFNFGQALWGCDLGVIGNWHAGTSPDGGGPSAAGADGNGNGGGSAAGVGAADTGSGGGGSGGGGGDLNGF